jgi:hypothetical protein
MDIVKTNVSPLNALSLVLVLTTIAKKIESQKKTQFTRGQTIYQINQRLSVALQRNVGEQLIACECTG